MPVANTADNYKLGDLQVDAVYAGDVKVWPQQSFTPLAVTLVYDTTSHTGDVRFSAAGDYTVDWGDASAVESFAANDPAVHTYTPSSGSFTAIVTAAVAGESLTEFTQSPLFEQPTEIYIDAPALITFSQVVENPNKQNLTKVHFAQVDPTCNANFAGEALLTAVTGSLAGTDFSSMFESCVRLTTVDLDTSAGTTFDWMFYGCISLPDVTLNTSAGTDFNNMFGGCLKRPTNVTLDTSAGENFSNMFNSCTSLAATPPLDTSAGLDFSGMFENCIRLTTVDLDASAGTMFDDMFKFCTALTDARTDFTLDTSSGEGFSYMFSGCTALTHAPALVTSSGVSFWGMFSYCTALTDVPLLDTSAGTSFADMFLNCTALTTIPLLDTSAGGQFGGMFRDCTALTAVPALDVSAITVSASNMFENCTSLALILAHGFRYTVGVQYTILSTADVDLFFTNLGTADNSTTQQMMYITNNTGASPPGAAGCDPTIATTKGWVVD